ncbi:MAG: tRNA epoxyqueuosine(34) reductase QueG [Acidobacteria bacterium]|nr:tRNA epoxyqueuosine(34) reductase QueG [Acidobacteriota bacterium]
MQRTVTGGDTISIRIKQLAAEFGFVLCGVARAEPLPEWDAYMDWVGRGNAAGMGYLTDHRARVRRDPRELLATARSVICLGMLYNSGHESNTDPAVGRISRYAWGEDYHRLIRERLEAFAARLHQEMPEPFEHRAVVDTAPLLERAYANRAGLGWIGRNTCLIHEPLGSWFFLAEVLVSLDLAPGEPPPDRCGSCTACIDACPTGALVPVGERWELDSRLCISYHTIESREPIPPEIAARHGNMIFGCDICQDVCPWNRKAPVTSEPAFAPRTAPERLVDLVGLDAAEFRERFAGTPVLRARQAGFQRNVEAARANYCGVSRGFEERS